MSCGLAEYISTGTCPTPAIVQEWDRIPDALVQSFTPPGFCNGDCFSAGQGLGDAETITIGSSTFNVTAPGGYFSGDASQWGIAEWGTIVVGLYAMFSLIGDVKTHARKASRAAKAYRSA